MLFRSLELRRERHQLSRGGQVIDAIRRVAGLHVAVGDGVIDLG